MCSARVIESLNSGVIIPAYKGSGRYSCKGISLSSAVSKVLETIASQVTGGSYWGQYSPSQSIITSHEFHVLPPLQIHWDIWETVAVPSCIYTILRKHWISCSPRSSLCSWNTWYVYRCWQLLRNWCEVYVPSTVSKSKRENLHSLVWWGEG